MSLPILATILLLPNLLFMFVPITKIICKKILQNIERQTIGQIFKTCCLILLGIVFTLSSLYPDFAKMIAHSMFIWNSHAIVKTVIIFSLVFNFSRIWQMCVKIYKNRSSPQKVATGATIEWIPTLELLDHLFEHQSFKREDIENKFWIPRNRYTLLATKLESIWVLKKGLNNARVLNEEYTRADIASILQNVTSAKDLKQVFRQISPTGYSREPQKESMIERITSALEPLPSPRRFELHRLEN